MTKEFAISTFEDLHQIIADAKTAGEARYSVSFYDTLGRTLETPIFDLETEILELLQVESLDGCFGEIFNKTAQLEELVSDYYAFLDACTDPVDHESFSWHDSVQGRYTRIQTVMTKSIVSISLTFH